MQELLGYQTSVKSLGVHAISASCLGKF
uniref:Uncharacterized protein n=1 Tax=Anguilla anguilla TaxID=7936 RepID=A0A0E9WRE9_ANGAN